MLDGWGGRAFTQIFYALTTLLVVATSACSVSDIGVQTSDNKAVSTAIVKSDNDNRDYRYLELENQLRVLLISDPDTDKSAASLDVHVGSGSDPKESPGLAHFLEHMLFLGTKKYPLAGEYQSFISSHNGGHNAYTSFEHTNYFFDIDPVYFDPALDRFSQFFIAPLFTQKYVEREKNAVHSEYTSKIKDDYRKAIDVFKGIINPDHPFSKFTVGNLETLSASNGVSLRDQLLKFYAQYYSSSTMSLVVLSKEPLDELESMVRSKFTAVPNNGNIVKAIDTALFAAEQLPLMVEIQPEKELRTLSITFPTADPREFYQQKPMHYIGNILGHEGNGSLLSYLKSQGWAEGLSAGAGLSYAGGATFNVSITLTAEGLLKTDEIINSVFQTINRIKDSSGVNKRETQLRLFEEQRAISEQQFRYQEQFRPMNYVMSLSTNMHYYPLQDVLRGDQVMTEFDSALVETFLDYLTPANSLVTLSSPTAQVDQKTYYYGTQFSVRPIDSEQLQRWKNAGLNPQIKLPEKNQFIASHLDLKPQQGTATVPEKLIDNDGLRLWFKQDQHFQLPKGSLFFSFRTPLASDSAQNKAHLQMLTDMTVDQLNELSYPASLAGQRYSLHDHGRGFSVKMHGFVDKQEVLLKKIIGALTSPGFDPQRFENIRRENIRKLENVSKQQPYHLLMRKLPEMLYQHQWSEQQLLEAYETMTLASLQVYGSAVLASGEIDMLVYGNYSKQEALDYGESVRAALLHKFQPPKVVEVVKLPVGSLSQRVNSDYSDAALVLYLQAADIDKPRRAAMGVTAQILRSDFYTELRTEKQLGYIVSAGAYPVLDVPGLLFVVQSPVAGPAALQEEIDGFISRQQQAIGSMSGEDFTLHRDALVLRLEEAPKNLWEQSEEYWSDIANNYYQFDFKRQLVSALKALDLKTWKDFYIAEVAGKERRGVWIYAAGQFATQSTLDAKPIDDVNSFKSTQPTYKFK